MKRTKSGLWTKNFTVITIASSISMLGNVLSAFAISFLILDYTGSTLLYALYLVLNNVPKIAMPIIAGPFLDRFSRKTVLYVLDFLSAGLYFGMFLLLRGAYFSYALLLAATVLYGAIDGVYSVAYDSLYPNLVHKGAYTKAYSVSSMIYPLATLLVPAASLLYDAVGIAPIFLVNAGTFLVASVLEAGMTVTEPHKKPKPGAYSWRAYKQDYQQGLRYIENDKGLMAITVYFFLMMLCDAVQNTLVLPYFKTTPGLSELKYTVVVSYTVLGRLIGSGVQYWVKYPASKKFMIACAVYIGTCFLNAGLLFMPLLGMMLFELASGVLGVTSFNIRISTTQDYVPDANRARFNGAFSMLCTVGTIVGQLIAGAIGETMSVRLLVVLFSCINMTGAMIIMGIRAKHIKRVYNRDV